MVKPPCVIQPLESNRHPRSREQNVGARWNWQTIHAGRRAQHASPCPHRCRVHAHTWLACCATVLHMQQGLTRSMPQRKFVTRETSLGFQLKMPGEGMAGSFAAPGGSRGASMKVRSRKGFQLYVVKLNYPVNYLGDIKSSKLCDPPS